VTQQMIAKSAARWLPVIGALGVGGYAYYDTAQVGATATKLFANDIGPEEADPVPDTGSPQGSSSAV
jgi:hypothetical protein